jgi:RHS repeat-associated protein
MGDVTARNGKKIAKTGDSAAANTTGGPVAQATNRLVKGGGAGTSGAKGKKGAAKASKTKGVSKGHPVSVTDGQVVDDLVDLTLPGPIPVVWRRLYSSAFHDESTPFGRGGWTHELHQWVAIVDGELVLRGEDGHNLVLPSVESNAVALHRGRRLNVSRVGDHRYEIESLDTLITRVFAPLTEGAPAMLRELRDRWGNKVTLVYQGNQLASVQAFGRELRIGLDDGGRVRRVEVWAQRTLQQSVSYAYTEAGELARATDALGSFDQYAYDGLHRLAKITLKNGVSFYYSYDDDLDRCIHTHGDGDIYAVDFVYDVGARTTWAADEEARKYTWNERGALVREETYDADFVHEYVYDDDLLVVAEKNALGETTRYEYDARGNRTKVVDAAGNETHWEFENDFPVKRTSPDGLVTEYVFDPRGALLELRTPTGLAYHLTYDGFGQLLAVFGSVAEGTLSAYEYDENHRLVLETSARGATTTFTYDAMGRPLKRTDGLGQTTTVDYDLLGRPARIQRADGRRIELGYDVLGNVVRHVDPMGHVTQMEYAGTGVLVRQRTPDGQVWRFQYDGLERIRCITNPLCEEYRFAYDRAGRVEQEVTFDGRTTNYKYSRANHLFRLEHNDKTWHEFQYDPLGNVVSETSSHGPQLYKRDRLGRLLEATVIEHNGKTVVQFERDPLGRVVAEVQNGQAVRYEYDAHGRRTLRHLPGGETTHYAWDKAGAIARVDHDGHVLDWSRDVLGRELSRRASRGQFEMHSRYDVLGHLTDRWATAPARAGEAAQTVLSRRKWLYDANGRLTTVQDVRWGTTAYQYNDIGQLIEAHRGERHEIFEYDGAGSVVAMLRDFQGSGHRHWHLAPGNVALETPEADFEYDANGRRIKATRVGNGRATKEITEYFWDCRDRLREVDLPGGEKVLYTYDAFGRRVRKEIVPPESRHGPTPFEPPRVRVVEFLWDGNALAQEVDTESGKRVFVHEPRTLVPLLQQECGEVFTYVNDHIGTPKELLDGSGTVAWAGTHSVWGKVVESWTDPTVKRARPIQTPFRLLGQYADIETSLCYTRFRYFDPERSRWISPDPLGVAGGSNLFGFDGAPTIYADPFGLCTNNNITYGPLDALGRPTGARATLTEDLLGTGSGANRRILPPGWDDLPSDNRGRGHLIGQQYGGSGNDPENLIAMYQNHANSPTMRDVENGIAASVAGGETVNLQVTPVYVGDEPVARGVTIDAQGNNGTSVYMTVLNQPKP